MGVPEAVALEIPAEEGSPAARVPPRIRRRLLQARAASGGAPATVEEIEAKLRDAHLRRQVGRSLASHGFGIFSPRVSIWVGFVGGLGDLCASSQIRFWLVVASWGVGFWSGDLVISMPPL